MVAGSLLLASLSWTASSLARRLPAEQETQADLGRLAPMITKLIEEAGPSRGRDQFGGDAKSLSATVPPLMAVAGAGPLRLTLAVRPHEGGEALFASFAPTNPASLLPAEARGERLLASGFADIAFEYEQGGKNALPRLITIRFTDESGGSRRISAAPRLNSDGRCRFDPISMTCRR